MNPNKLKPYFFNIILIWLIVLFYKTFPYYKNFIRPETFTTIFYLAISYTLFGFIYHLYRRETKETTGLIIFNSLKNLKLDKKSKTAFLFLSVKVFFLPIMLNFFFNNFFSFNHQLQNFSDLSLFFSLDFFNAITFPFLLTSLFMIDTLWFSFGYAFESGFLNNSIRSVEPTFIGWAVALSCYPPFNTFVVKYIDWYANDYVLFFTPTITFIMRITIILFLTIYVSATLALGTKSSNLTNRGIVSRGPYKFIRHPAYISKNLAWWLTILPIASIPAILSMSAWSIIYHIRSITEEKHLMLDPDYQEYCKKVKWRYIPGIY